MLKDIKRCLLKISPIWLMYFMPIILLTVATEVVVFRTTSLVKLDLPRGSENTRRLHLTGVQARVVANTSQRDKDKKVRSPKMCQAKIRVVCVGPAKVLTVISKTVYNL